MDNIFTGINSCAGRLQFIDDLLRDEIDGEPVESLITKEQAIKLMDIATELLDTGVCNDK